MFQTTDHSDAGHRAASTPTGRILLTILLAWLAMLGFDFFLHAGLLARLYLDPGPFLLSPLEAFRRVPLGYLSFLFSAMLLVWLMVGLRQVGWRAGAAFGLKLGAFVWGALVLGLFSVSTADPMLLFGWFVGQTLELGLAGAVAGIGLMTDKRIRRLSLQVMALVLFFAIVTIVLQSAGLAPAARLQS